MPLGIILAESDTAVLKRSWQEVELVMLERTLFDPPRVSAATRWAEAIRSAFPAAKLVLYAWHLVTHRRDDPLPGRGTRTLAGPPTAFGHLQQSREADQAWDVMVQCAEAIGANTIALRTPAALTPGAVGRARLTAFAEARTRGGLRLVWEPEGLWEPAEALALATATGTTLLWRPVAPGRHNFDPDAAEALPGAWLRVDALGRHARLGAEPRDALQMHLEDHPTTTVIFSGPRALENLRTVATAASPP